MIWRTKLVSMGGIIQQLLIRSQVSRTKPVNVGYQLFTWSQVWRTKLVSVGGIIHQSLTWVKQKRTKLGSVDGIIQQLATRSQV